MLIVKKKERAEMVSAMLLLCNPCASKTSNQKKSPIFVGLGGIFLFAPSPVQVVLGVISPSAPVRDEPLVKSSNARKVIAPCVRALAMPCRAVARNEVTKEM